MKIIFEIEKCLICGKLLEQEILSKDNSYILYKCPDINHGIYKSEYAVEVTYSHILQIISLYKYELSSFIYEYKSDFTYISYLHDNNVLLKIPFLLIDRNTDLLKLKLKIDKLILLQ